MGRKLYYVDGWGHVQRDRKAERSASGSGGFSGMRIVYAVLLVLAVLMVLASIHG